MYSVKKMHGACAPNLFANKSQSDLDGCLNVLLPAGPSCYCMDRKDWLSTALKKPK